VLRELAEPEFGELLRDRQVRAGAARAFVEELAHQIPESFGEACLLELTHERFDLGVERVGPAALCDEGC